MRSLTHAPLVIAVSISLLPLSCASANESVDAGDLPRSSDWTSIADRTSELEAEVASLRELARTAPHTPSGSRYVCDGICPGWSASVDYLHWKLRRRGLDFAISTDAVASAVGTGSVINQEFGWDSGIRTEITYLTQSGWEIAFGYTFFDTGSSGMAAEPAGGNLFATQNHPSGGGSRLEEAALAEASGGFQLHVFDLSSRYRWTLSRHASAGLIGGLRWAMVDQGQSILYDGRDFDNAQVDQQLTMSGFGLRLGAEGNWHLPFEFSMFGQFAGTVMYGRYRSHLLETNASGGDTIVDLRDSYKQVLPVLETVVGVSWQHDWIELSGGYEFASWFDLADNSRFADDSHEGAYRPASADVLLDGFFLRGLITF